MVGWQLVFTRQAQKDAKKIAHAGFKLQTNDYLKSSEKIPLKLPLHTKSLSATCREPIHGESTFSTDWFIRSLKISGQLK